MDGCFVAMVNGTHAHNSVTKETVTVVGGQHLPSMTGLGAGLRFSDTQCLCIDKWLESLTL